MKHIEGTCLMSLSQLFYILQNRVTLLNILCCLCLYLENFEDIWIVIDNYQTDICQAQTYQKQRCCVAVLGWGDWPDILLLLQPSLKVTNTVFADCICLFIHSQIWISCNLEQYHKHNRESCHSNADPEEMNRDLFLVIISQISFKINSNTRVNI